MPRLPDGVKLQTVTATHIAALKTLRSPLLDLVELQKEIWSKKSCSWSERFEELWSYAQEFLYFNSHKERFCFSFHLFFVKESALKQLLTAGAKAIRKAAREFRERFSAAFHNISQAGALHFCYFIAPRLDGSGGLK